MMYFTVDRETGAITVDKWDSETDISVELIEAADLIKRDGDRITIKVANGEALYIVTGEDERTVHTILSWGLID